MMRQILGIITVLYLVTLGQNPEAQTYVLSAQTPLTWETLPLSPKIKKNLEKEVFAKSEVKTLKKNNQQSLDLFIAGLHKTHCSRALVKISQYERYKDFIGFIKESSYNKQNSNIALLMDHTLLPFKMSLAFGIERITKPGLYPFIFKKGFLAGLKGQVHVSKRKQNCLFVIKAYWKGPDTKIPDSVFSFFSQALGQRAMERMFQISRTL
jgi:hypothetical protein